MDKEIKEVFENLNESNKDTMLLVAKAMEVAQENNLKKEGK